MGTFQEGQRVCLLGRSPWEVCLEEVKTSKKQVLTLAPQKSVRTVKEIVKKATTAGHDLHLSLLDFRNTLPKEWTAPRHSIFSHAEAELYYPWLASCCSPNQCESQITRKKTETSLLLQHVGAKALGQLRGSQKGSQNGSKVDQKADVFCYKVHTEDGQLYHSDHPPLDKIS